MDLCIEGRIKEDKRILCIRYRGGTKKTEKTPESVRLPSTPYHSPPLPSPTHSRARRSSHVSYVLDPAIVRCVTPYFIGSRAICERSTAISYISAEKEEYFGPKDKMFILTHLWWIYKQFVKKRGAVRAAFVAGHTREVQQRPSSQKQRRVHKKDFYWKLNIKCFNN